MNRLRLFAGALVAASLTGCIMLPPPPPMFHRPPPGFRGEGGAGAPMPFGDARRPPSAREPSARDMCDARCAPGAPDAQAAPGAR
ncbi:MULTISPECIES: hypothetical protein [unclassified Variovorax]|jgi:hypothetical protein|uniref:hypothetical protein n=1 Tax=unclassified Variovorax TaxID=663243 RepID=UPI0008C3F8BB|nr:MULTISPECIES: hypothetical protein [unclassified Variovorax]SEK13832.1 hypothetical protein SAMN05518853_11393 [Variovorax sp. OK202]SFD92021.1 hypothetical protein SAMN05444746_11393 [Variovorax sp. OK212]